MFNLKFKKIFCLELNIKLFEFANGYGLKIKLFLVYFVLILISSFDMFSLKLNVKLKCVILNFKKLCFVFKHV